MNAAPIVITGSGLITSLGQTRMEVWQAVQAARCGIGPMPAMESPLAPDKDGGQAVEIESDLSDDAPREVRYLRRAILDALRESFGDTKINYAPSKCGIILGTTLHGMRAGGKFLRGDINESLNHFLAGATLREACAGLPFEGIAATTCSACSSSLGSIALAITLLQTHQCDLVIAGGYDTISEYAYGGFNSLRLVADGPLRPFSKDRKGMKLAEGYGIVVLERADDAAQRSANSLATILGWGESADAHHLTQPHPTGEGAAAAMHQALQRANLSPSQIGLIVAHATGTPDNDAAEFAAMHRVFADALPTIPAVAFKSHLGHTLGGAGAVELLLAMTAMQQQSAPPCATITAADIEFPELNLTTQHAKPAAIQSTLNTSLGFGGANTSIILGPPIIDVAETSPPLREVFISGIGVMIPGFSEINFHTELPVWNRLRQDVSDSEFEKLLNARRVRRMSSYVKLQLAAATLACRNANISDLSTFAANCPAILGTMHGSCIYSHEYYSQIIRDGIGAANPLLFAEGVPNAAAAQLSLMLGLRGACQTIIGTRTAGLDALNLAAARIASGAWDRAIVGAGEEYSELIDQTYARCGLSAQPGTCKPPLSDASGFFCGAGAVAFVLESRKSLEQRKQLPIGKITKWAAARSEPNKLPRAVRSTLNQLDAAEVIFSSACNTWIDHAELAAISSEFSGIISSIYGHAPELFSAGPLAAIATALASGRVPRFATDQNIPAASGEEIFTRFNILASDFNGGVAGTSIERV